jgi:membrane-bound lytic murein transglycosylase D
MTGCGLLLPRGRGRFFSVVVATWLATWLAGCATSNPGPTPIAPAQAAAEPAAAYPVAAATIVAPAAKPTPRAGQPEVAAIDPLRPSAVIDGDDAGARADLWVRVRMGFAMPELQNTLVVKWEQWYSSRPDYVQRMTERGGRYLFYVVEEIQKRGMPTELALLPFVESAFNPQAMSVARASGMWQFMPATGKDFDLKQNVFRDDRRDVLASTRAALDYLQMLYGQFNDWQLALAAYNWGQGNVQRAVDRNLKAGLPADYENLRMPDETRNYVPKLQAVKNIVQRPQDYAIVLPALQNHPYFLSVPITNDINVAVAAKLAGISVDEFKQLNPQLNKPVILAAGTPQVLLPYDNATLFAKNLQAHRAPLATWTAWVAPATMRPADVAKQVGMSEDELRDVNLIPPRMLVKSGSTLLVPRSPHKADDVSERVADSAMMLLAPDLPPARRISFKAGKGGDSVVAVAKRYRVGVDQVASWNGVSPQARFASGQSVIVMQPVAPGGTRASAPAAPTRTAEASTKPAPVRGADAKAKPATPRATATAAARPASRPAPPKVASSKPTSKL